MIGIYIMELYIVLSAVEVLSETCHVTPPIQSTLDTSSSSNTSAGSAVATTPTAVTTRSGGRRKKDSKEEMKK